MITLIAAAGAAAAMYYFDPESGERRRALLRDKFSSLKDEFGDVRGTAEGKLEHFTNVAKGMAHESGIKRVSDADSGSNAQTGAALNASSMSDRHESHESHEAPRDTGQPTSRAA
jgi:gas vesicle protein